MNEGEKIVVIVGIVIWSLILIYNYIKLHEENERNKDRLTIERRAKMMYKLHGDKLYEQLLDEQKEATRARREADMYKTLAMVFQAQKKSAPMAVGNTHSENNTISSIAESEGVVNG